MAHQGSFPPFLITGPREYGWKEKLESPVENQYFPIVTYPGNPHEQEVGRQGDREHIVQDEK